MHTVQVQESVLEGSCHCGQLAISFLVRGLPVEELQPRLCDCSFCCKHGAAYLSDPKGSLVISEQRAGSLHEYRQGSKTAQFVLCRHCGVLVAVLYQKDGQSFGTVNVRCLDSKVAFAPSKSVSPQTLSAEEKTSRWAALWIPQVELRRASES